LLVCGSELNENRHHERRQSPFVSLVPHDLLSIPLGSLFLAMGQKKESFPLLDPSVLGRPFEGPYPFAIGFPATAYYLTGPQQAKPPDGSFPKGVRVALILDAGSYSLVTSKSGITAYVSSDALHLVK
tara:strand:+ start:1140 stop:1523 length:384 start_codon:yes stop_codon:yes gene_type:complete